MSLGFHFPSELLELECENIDHFRVLAMLLMNGIVLFLKLTNDVLLNFYLFPELFLYSLFFP